MGWWALAAAAVPYVVDAMTPDPQMPSNSAANIRLPDRSKYSNMILDTAFNPNSNLYEIARERQIEAMNRHLTGKGLSNSTLGAQMMAMSNAELSNKFLENELQRQISGYGAVTGYDLAEGNLRAGIANGADNHAWRLYENQVDQNNKRAQDWGNFANAAVGMYERNDERDYNRAMQERNMRMYEDYMGSASNNIAPTGGRVVRSSGYGR